MYRRRDDWNEAWATGAVPRDFESTRGRSGGLLSAAPPPMGKPTTKPAAGSFIIDTSGTILAFDRNMERLTGWDAFDVVGRSSELGTYTPPDELGVRTFHTHPLFEGHIPRVRASSPLTLALRRRDGARLEVEVLVTPVGGQSGRLAIEVQRVVSRVSAPADDAAEANRDAMTRLPGAAEFHGRLRSEFEEARVAGRPLSVLLVDIDHLDAINQDHGRGRGDLVLRQVAGILTVTVRQSDMVARVEQDDFAILLFGVGRGDARSVGGRIRKAIESFNFAGPGRDPIPVSVSIGVASFPADGEAPHELLRRAGDALGEAHRLGRNRVWSYVRRPRINVNIPVYFDGPSSHLLGTSRDLSNSGIFVASHDDLPAGMRVGLAFSLPGQFDPVKVIGRVARRVSLNEDTEDYMGLGIEFEQYTDRDRWRLEAFLHQERETHGGPPAVQS